jgi:hypothetical protein
LLRARATEEDDVKEQLLRDCKACGKQISRHSPFCRNCGHPQSGVLVRWIVVALALLMLAFSIALFFVLHLARLLCP